MAQKTLPKAPHAAEPEFNKVVASLEEFCNAKLNDEYYQLTKELTTRIARKRPSPLLSGSPKTWAVGIIHALGMVNFLFDKSQSPHISSKELCEWFQLGQSTISAKSKAIRDMFKMHPFDPKWCLPSKLDSNPMAWLVSINGFLIDIRRAPYELQAAAYEAGVIPYIPGDRKQ